MRSRPLARRCLPVVLAAVACLGVPATAHAAAPSESRATASGPSPAAVTALAGSRQLGITMQVQQQSNWCWAASGNTVATFYGYGYSQNTFCNLAFDRYWNSTCPNSQASLSNDQEAFWQLGISPGSYVNGYLSYSRVTSEIDAGRPVMSRIQWRSGGGHMEVLYGYDTSRQWVYWGDPWGSDSRYNWASWSYYVSNNSFSWTHSLYGIGA